MKQNPVLLFLTLLNEFIKCCDFGKYFASTKIPSKAKSIAPDSCIIAIDTSLHIHKWFAAKQ